MEDSAMTPYCAAASLTVTGSAVGSGPSSGAGYPPPQGATPSIWAARPNSVASSKRRPTSWTPIGRPSADRPSGSEIAG